MKPIINSFYQIFTLTILLSFSQLTALATSVTVSGNVNGQWAADTVFVADDAWVLPDNTLIIDPGTRVIFAGHYKLTVFGVLKASGTVYDSILFTVRDTTGFHVQDIERGGWAGIVFQGQDGSASDEDPFSNNDLIRAGQDSSFFSYCRFEFGKATIDSLNSFGGAIRANSYNNLRLSNCYFYCNYSYFSGGAVFLIHSDVVIEKCKFSKNYSGNTGVIYGYGGGVCSMFSAPVISENYFYQNISTGVGGAVSFDASDPVFNFNILDSNLSGLGGGLGILRSDLTNTLCNNLVINNEAVFFGGGICFIRSNPVISNFTIADNKSIYGGGIYCNDSTSPALYNTIIWGNTGSGISVYIWDGLSVPDFYYCNIEGDTTMFMGTGGAEGYSGNYQNNINTDPLFIANSKLTYQLPGNSSCVNSGTPDPIFLDLPVVDLGGNPRINNNLIDMGAYEYQSAMLIGDITAFQKTISAYPNPFKSEIKISFSKPGDLYIYNISGQVVKNLSMSNCCPTTLPDGSKGYEVIWDGKCTSGGSAPSGVYLFTSTGRESVRVVKL